MSAKAVVGISLAVLAGAGSGWLAGASLLTAGSGERGAVTAPVPSRAQVDGFELVTVFISYSDCPGNRIQDFASVIAQMNRHLRAAAPELGVGFGSVGVSVDWSPDVGYDFLRRIDEFDEIVTGRNWFNTGAAAYLFRNLVGQAVIPQVLLLAREVRMEGRVVTIGPDEQIMRLVGPEAIIEWAEAGFPLPDLPDLERNSQAR